MTPQDPSYASTFGILSPWGLWLLRQAPELLANDAGWFKGQTPPTRTCPGSKCGQPMSFRPGAFKCYRHDPPIESAIEHKYPRAPRANVLARVGQMLDYQWNPDERRWEIMEVG